MKKVSYIVVFVFLAFAASAQSLKIVDTDANQRGIIGKDIRTTLKIKNITNEPIYFSVSEVKKQIGSSQKSFICIDNDCGKNNIALRTEKIPAMIIKIMPGKTSESIVAVLESGLIASISSITYRFTNVKHPNDFVDFEFHYDITERPSEGLLYSSTNVDLTDVYPNPVTEFAIFDYKIKDDSKEAKIIIHNVLGSIAGEYKLNPFEQQLKVSVEDFNPGVYFYSLYIDNEGVATKKLVVRK